MSRCEYTENGRRCVVDTRVGGRVHNHQLGDAAPVVTALVGSSQA